MFTLKIENANGEMFELTHDTSNYYVVGVTGLTPPTTSINTATGGISDGGYYNSSKVEQRNIVIDVILNGDIETNRQRLYKIFNIKRQCTIYFKNKNRDVKINGYVEVIEGDLFSQREEMQISIICPRPYFEELNDIYVELSRFLRLFEFPFSISHDEPVELSEIVDYPQCIVVNNGDVECGCIIDVNFTGNVNDFTIVNSTTQTIFKLNYVFIAGDELIINTNSGEMGVTLARYGHEYNLLNYITSNSTWFKLGVGENVFTYTSSGSLSEINIQFNVSALYGGV